MMKQFVYILFVFFVISCQDIQPVKNPADLIDQAKMEEILYDIAIVNAARGYDSKYGVAPETYIFEKYDIDSLQYAENVSYYSSDIESYKDMYLAIQKRVEGEFTYHDSLAKIEKKVKDSIRTERAKELQREKDSIKRVDSLKGKKQKPRLPISRISKEIFIDSL
jgi:hypothetical protein